MKKLLIAILFLVRAAAASNGDINGLLEEFSGTVTKGGNATRLLSPAVVAKKAAMEQEKRKLAPQYLEFQITDLNFVKADRRSDSRIDVPATIHWKSVNGEVNQTAVLRLEFVNGAWYFTDFDFAVHSVSFLTQAAAFLTIFAVTFTFMAKPWQPKKKAARKAAPAIRTRFQPGKAIILSAIPGLYE